MKLHLVENLIKLNKSQESKWYLKFLDELLLIFYQLIGLALSSLFHSVSNFVVQVFFILKI